jgi:hypothetical protein
MSKFEIHGHCASCVGLELRSLERPASEDYWDANWITANGFVQVRGFKAAIDLTVRTSEIEEFLDSILRVNERAESQAALQSMEDAIEITLQLLPAGQLLIAGRLREARRRGCTLEFAFESDLTFLEASITQLRHCVGEFPVRP